MLFGPTGLAMVHLHQYSADKNTIRDWDGRT